MKFMILAIVSANFLSVQLTVALWLLAGIAVALAAQTAPKKPRMNAAAIIFR